MFVFAKCIYFTPCALFESPVCTSLRAIVPEVVNSIAESIVNQYVNIPEQITNIFRNYLDLFISHHVCPIFDVID